MFFLSLNRRWMLILATSARAVFIELSTVFSEPMPTVPSLPLQRRTWMITCPLIARPHLPPPQPNTLRTTAFSHSTQPLPLPHPSMTRLHHAARRFRLTAAFTTSPAATPRTRCCSQSPPPHLQPIRTAVTPSSTSSTLRRGRPRWSRRCATFPSVTISRPHLVQTAPTRCLERCHHQQELQKLAMWYLLLDLPNLC